MSIVYITNHDENIFDARKIPQGVIIDQPEMYEPQAYKNIVKERKPLWKHKKHGTMGLSRVSPPDPTNFLKKGTLKPPARKSKETDQDYGLRKRSVGMKQATMPTRYELLLEQDAKLAKWKPKNAIRENIEYAKTMEPKVPERRTMVDRKGTSEPLKPSLEPTFLPSIRYGKLPKYLDTYLKDKEKQRMKQAQQEERTQPKCRYLTRDRRKDLLRGLKKNWAELQGQYSLLPILTDTIPKKNRKSKLEAELKQLEKDIVVLERHAYIYVYPDEEDLRTRGTNEVDKLNQ